MFKANLITLLLISFCGFSVTSFSAVHQYFIDVDEKIAHVSIKMCFDGKPPEYLMNEYNVSSEDVIDFPSSEQGKIGIQGRYWNLKALPENACVDYRVNIARHHTKRADPASKRKNIAYIEKNTWLWLPEIMEKTDDVELLFQVPGWAEISTPWLQKDPSEHRYRLGNQPQDWGYRLVIGDFSVHRAQLSDKHLLNIAYSNDMPKAQAIKRWLVDSANSLIDYLGVYPARQTQVMLISKSKLKQGPVPWADFSRGNGFGILFVIVPSHKIRDFYTDWTATHEFSHQLLPKIQYNDIWLSEGLSSYLQYVLMAQSEVISAEQAWLKIYQGFQRGEKGTKQVAKEPLYHTSSRRKSGGRSGRTMRIYWSGALYFLKADVALRNITEGKVGLNDILLKLNRCCIKSSKAWRGKELAMQLDWLSHTHIFSKLYAEFANGTTFPDYDQTFKQLGITFTTEKKLDVRIEKHSLAYLIME